MAQEIPLIDPSVKHIGVSKLRGFSATRLRETTDTFVIQENDSPLAVLVSYEKYLILQEQLVSVLNTMEMITDKTEMEGIKAGVEDLQTGRTRTLAEIRAGLNRRG